MDQREVQIQTLGICNRLYNFIKKTLMMHALKSVTLGDPLHRNLFKAQNKAIYVSDQMVIPRVQQEMRPQGVGNSNNMQNSNTSAQATDANTNGERPEAEEEAPLPSVEAKPPKKAVSINERVEEIDTSKKKIRRKKSKENLTSFEKEEDEPKPLKSILKVGSHSGEKSNSFVK